MKGLTLIIIIIISSFFTSKAQSQGLLGGEIRWDCISPGFPNSGKFVFYLTVYQACYNDSVLNPVLPNMQLIESSAPSGNTVFGLLPNYPKDVSPTCNLDINLCQTACGTADSISAFNGAYKVYVYSDTLLLNGIPPVSGWLFKWNGGERSRSSNLIDSLIPNMQLRSKMYAFNNFNTYPCFDNAPSFAEKPVVMTCNGYSFQTIPIIMEKELDSVIVEWDQLIDTLGNNIQFDPNHNYLNPLPNISDNSNNIPATLNPHNGALNITSYTTGGFFANQKTSSYKCGILVSEIFRDMYFQFNDCDSNVSPIFISPFANLSIIDSVYAGERIAFNLNFVDSQLLSNNMIQSVSMQAYSVQFGNYIPANGSNPAIFDTVVGCLNPPCATLNKAPSDSFPLYDTAQISTKFSWQTDCVHLVTNIGCGITTNEYEFYFKFWDDYCPVPAYNTAKLTIVILPTPNLSPPIFDSLAVDSSTGNIQLMWHPVVDTSGLFMQYYIYSKINQNAYVLLDSVNNVSDSTYLHQGANALNQSCSYYLRVKYSWLNSVKLSGASDSLHNDFIPPPIKDLELMQVWDPFTMPQNKVHILAKNIGNEVVDSIKFTYYQPDSTIVLENWNGNIAAGDSLIYIFNQAFVPSANLNYQLCVNANVIGDADTLNNYKCIQTSLGIEILQHNDFHTISNIPNPANESTNIRFVVPNSGLIKLSVYNISGSVILDKEILSNKGLNTYLLNTSRYEAGVYFYRIEYKGKIVNDKFIVIP